MKTLHRRCLIRFLIYQGSEYTMVVNTPGFWICQASEYTRVLSMPGLWTHYNSVYASGTDYTRVLNMPRLWIYHGSEYASGTEYARVTEGFDYACEYICLCLSMSEYARIWMNISTSSWIVLLSKGTIGCFLEEKKFDFF